jgi:hypothetical protein
MFIGCQDSDEVVMLVSGAADAMDQPDFSHDSFSTALTIRFIPMFHRFQCHP